ILARGLDDDGIAEVELHHVVEISRQPGCREANAGSGSERVSAAFVLPDVNDFGRRGGEDEGLTELLIGSRNCGGHLVGGGEQCPLAGGDILGKAQQPGGAVVILVVAPVDNAANIAGVDGHGVPILDHPDGDSTPSKISDDAQATVVATEHDRAFEAGCRLRGAAGRRQWSAQKRHAHACKYVINSRAVNGVPLTNLMTGPKLMAEGAPTKWSPRTVDSNPRPRTGY